MQLRAKSQGSNVALSTPSHGAATCLSVSPQRQTPEEKSTWATSCPNGSCATRNVTSFVQAPTHSYTLHLHCICPVESRPLSNNEKTNSVRFAQEERDQWISSGPDGKALGILPIFEQNCPTHNHNQSHVLASIKVAAKIESTCNPSQSLATFSND